MFWACRRKRRSSGWGTVHDPDRADSQGQWEVELGQFWSWRECSPRPGVKLQLQPRSWRLSAASISCTRGERSRLPRRSFRHLLWERRECLANYSGLVRHWREILDNDSGLVRQWREFLNNYSGLVRRGREFLENYNWNRRPRHEFLENCSWNRRRGHEFLENCSRNLRRDLKSLEQLA